jgi:hypothetical protein
MLTTQCIEIGRRTYMVNVALGSVGLDILFSQTNNNEDEAGHPKPALPTRRRPASYNQLVCRVLPGRSSQSTKSTGRWRWSSGFQV